MNIHFSIFLIAILALSQLACPLCLSPTQLNGLCTACPPG